MTVLPTVNERTTLALTVTFYDENDALVTPDSATYRIDAPTAGVCVQAATAIAGLSTSVTLFVSSAQNALVGHDPFEERVVTIDFLYSGDRRGTEEYRYQLKNLTGVS